MTDGGEDFNLGHVVGADGAKGDTGNGISSITKTSTSGKVDTYTITFTNGSTTTFQLTNGSDGAKGDKGDKGDTGNTGNGISSITKTGTSGLVDTYTITFTNGSTTTFTVTNGSNATVDIVTSWNSTTSDSKVPSEKLSKDSLDGKLDNAISSTAVSVASSDNILITDYSDSNKVKRVANVLASHVKDSSAHSNIGSSANATQSTINSSIDTALGGKQPSLVSGTNIKTVNNESLLGSGNINIQGGSTVDIVTSWSATLSDTKVPSEKLAKNSLDGKANSTHTHTVSNITDFPTIPSKTSDLNNDSGFITSSALTNYVQKSSTSGLVKNDGSIDTNTYLTSSAITGMLTTSDVANDLTTTTSGKVLDARQGKALADLIGAAIIYINQ